MNPSRINSDSQDRQKIRNKLEMSTDPLDPRYHIFAPSTVSVDKSVEMGKAQLEMFEKDWPAGFKTPISKK